MLRSLHIVFLFLVWGVTCAQELDRRLGQMDHFWLHNSQEKIYVHTDRSLYTAGENVWFKMYGTIGIENYLSVLSNIGYIELIDPLDRTVESQIIAINTGVGHGSIVLNDTLVEGTYRLRAYTNWMRNYATDYFFEKRIAITNGRADNVLTRSGWVSDASGSFYTVRLEDPTGAPLNGTRVRYQFAVEEEVVDKGSERTDESGLLRIKVNDRNRGKDLELTFTNQAKRTVSKVVHTDLLETGNSLQVLPEGGHILTGHPNNIAVKALRPNGLGIRASIELLDGESTVMGRTETNGLGMGAISFLPNPGAGYRLRARFEDGTEDTVDIPKALASGMSLMVNNRDVSRLFVQVSISEDRLSQGELYLVVYHLGKVYHVSKQKADKTSMVFSVPRGALPSGVLTVSLLDGSLFPIFERPVFNHNADHVLPLSVTVGKDVFTTRECVEVSLSVDDVGDLSQIAALSAAVTNLDRVPDTMSREANILSALLLESDLKGYIETPGYYFGKEGINDVELDYLMLTQGWRKMQWDELELSESPKRYEAETGLSVSGYVRRPERSVPVSNAHVQLIVPGEQMDVLDTVANKEGYFVFDDLVFADGTRFLLSARDGRGRKHTDIFLEETARPGIGKLWGGQNDLNTLYERELLATRRFFGELESVGLMSDIIEIEEVRVTRQEKKVPEYSRNLNGPGNADHIFTAEDLEGWHRLESALHSSIPGVLFKNGMPRNTRSRDPYGELAPLQLVIDGIFIDPAEAPGVLVSLQVSDIASVEVIRSYGYLAIYGSHGGAGIFLITTKRGADNTVNYRPEGTLSLQPKGISIPKEFYKPAYGLGSEQLFSKDLRTTIHWEPMIATDGQGKASFDFYTSDEPGIYRIVVEGIDLNGRIGRKVLEFEVKE